MISLDSGDLINSGKVRICYLHPANPNLVIKLPVGKKKEEQQANIKELKGYQILMREHVDLFCISHCYGFVNTNRGTGLVCDCIRDDNGEISKTIWDIIVCQEECDLEYIHQVIGEFCRFLIPNDIFIFDLNLKNIVLRLKHDGSYEPVVIDLKGRYESHGLMSLSRHIGYLGRRKLERKCSQLLDRILIYRKNRTEFQPAEKIFRGQEGLTH